MQEYKYGLVGGIQSLLFIYFFVSTVTVVLSTIIETANNITMHGKLCKIMKNPKGSNRSSKRIRSINSILGITVSKGCFCYFYLVGTIVTTAFIYLSHQKNYRLCLFLFHVVRRLFEELFISSHNTKYSRMNIFVFLYGISYYIMMPITLLSTEDIRKDYMPLQFAMFGIFSLIQYNTHVILSKIRDKSPDEYGIPYGGLFKYISCPHYFGEVGIYLSLFMDILNSRYIQSALLYIVVCMCLNAIRTHKWYIYYYEELYTRLGRKAIFPYII